MRKEVKNMDIEKETINQRIKRLRLEKNMSQEELALKVGYSDKSAICRIENGQNDVTQSKVLSLSKALGVSIAYLMDGKDTTLEDEFYTMSKVQQELFLKRINAYLSTISTTNTYLNKIDELDLTQAEQKNLYEYALFLKSQRR